MRVPIAVAFLLAVVTGEAASCYTVRLDDPKAVYRTPDSFGVRGDGLADDTESLQHAIDKVQETPARESFPCRKDAID